MPNVIVQFKFNSTFLQLIIEHHEYTYRYLNSNSFSGWRLEIEINELSWFEDVGLNCMQYLVQYAHLQWSLFTHFIPIFYSNKTKIKTLKNVMGCRDSRSATSIEQEKVGMIA